MPVSVEQLLSISLEVHDARGRMFIPGHYPREFVPNNIPGREGYEADVLALKEFNQSRGDVEALIAYFRRGCPESALSIGGVYALATGLNQLPLYLPLRPFETVDRDQIPVSIIDASRAAAGVAQIAMAIMAQDVDPSEHVSPETILDFATGNNADGRNFFVQPGDKTESCPAPPATVKRILHLMVYSSPDADIAEADWAPYVHARDIQQSVDFGTGLVLFLRYLNTYLELPKDSPEREAYRTSAVQMYARINSALGYA